MKLTFDCRCGAKFDILNKFKFKPCDTINCPNCGRPLPGESSKYAQEMLRAYNHLQKEFETAELFSFTVGQ